MRLKDFIHKFSKDDRGSAVTIMMGGVAVLAMLSFGAYQLISGPLTSASKATRSNLLQDQILSVAQIASMDASNLGDCDSDGYIEPRAWRDTTGAAPTNGGLIPTDMGAPVKDPWGVDYGYCVWDVGATAGAAGCGGASANRLDGADDPRDGDFNSLTVLAVISAGPDRSFQTTCSNFSDSSTDVIANTGDDIIKRYSYAEAATATSSLWALKANSTDIAQIDKNLEIGSNIVFDHTTGHIDALALTSSGFTSAIGGIKLANESAVSSCTTMTAGTLRYNTSIDGLEFCAGAGGWTPTDVSGSLFPIGAPDGSAAAPSYSFANQTSSGLFHNSTSFYLSAAGSDVAQLSAGSSVLSVQESGITLNTNGSNDITTAVGDNITFKNSGSDFRLISEGGLQMGNTTGACNSTTDGTMRYIVATDEYEYCNGTSWGAVAKLGGAQTPCSDDETAECTLSVTRSNDDSDFIADNIVDGANLLGVTGTVDTINLLTKWDGNILNELSGWYSSCNLKSDGEAYCWGSDSSNALGNSATYVNHATPNQIDSDEGPWLMMSKGGFFTCVLKYDGTIWCWGANGDGHIGAGTGLGSMVAVATQVSNPGPWSQMSSGRHHTCAIKADDGEMWCWGNDQLGALGNGSTETEDKYDPVPITESGPWIMVGAGGYFTCAIKADGTAWCWGSGYLRTLGNGGSSNTDDAVQVSDAGPWIHIDGGESHTCAVKADHTGWCWGTGSSGQLGDGNGAYTGSSVPVEVASSLKYQKIAAGGNSSCGLTVAGEIYCWGAQDHGQLGNGVIDGSAKVNTPTLITKEGPWLNVSISNQSTVCAVHGDGTMWCWGENPYSEVGNSTVSGDQSEPVAVEVTQ